ncbi:ABC transporter [Xylariaceae sp. FL0255]|nr:ABC transporter [Xylariaceae sp. FL0255]
MRSTLRVELTSSISSSTEIDRVHPKSKSGTESLPFDPQHHNTAQLSLNDVDRTDVQIRSLSVTVDAPPTFTDLLRNALGKDGSPPRRRVLLSSINASFQPGTLTAILGGSGSGKTTLLNTVAERVVSTKLIVTGTTRFNDVSDSVHSVRHAYVMQQDILVPTLTVRETLRYSAALRLPPPITDTERNRIVEEVILELGLKDCADTKIGNSQHRGCSGGEKRRTSIGVQLLANPSVLFLDEPTTGLDATSAYQLIRTLKSLAQKGRTIITTLHSPRSEIWNSLDNLILLSRGNSVYSGPINGCVPWFSSLGFELPPFVNPAEFIVDIGAVDNRTPELEEESSTRVDRLLGAWDAHSQIVFPLEKNEADNTSHPKLLRTRNTKHHASFWRQTRVLTSRTLKVTYRDPMGLAGSLFEAISMAIVTGYIFYSLPRDQTGIRSREGALYIAMALQGYLYLTFDIYRLTTDLPTFDREHIEGCVTPLPYLLSRRIARLFTEDIPVPFLYSVIFYFLVGFDLNVGKFFTFFAVVLLNHYIAVTLAMACVAAVRHFPGASLIANLSYTLQSMACGYFIQSNTIPVYVRWTKYITYSYYAFGALCSNEFEGSFYDCPYPGGASNPQCLQYTGRYILDNLGFPRNWVVRPIIIMLAFVILFFLTSWVGLELLKVEMTVAQARKSDTDLSTGKEKMTAKSVEEVRAIDLSLVDFALDLDKRSQWGKKLPTKSILNPVTTVFRAGQLNVIMGPSGSGKTSLLNAIAQRLNNSVATKYRQSGKLLFNDAAPSVSVIRSVVSYVCQDDDALLPSLTVRETLRFSAGLRLPPWMSKQEKNRRAEEVLLKVGLKDCADNLIGSDLVKGISGGEKRRVSIAVQILTDPRILLLDEPTSGLDAFTANSIMEVLNGLANEGRTVILTIHQARTDLFKNFGNILLLAGGGAPTYSGPARHMLNYFDGLGYQCPQHTNPADFALDLITVNLQEERREAESRERVKKLVSSWADVINQESTNLSKDTGTVKYNQPVEKERHSEGVGTVLEKLPSIPAARQSFRKAKLTTPAELGALVHKRASFKTAFPLLLHRATINFRRQPPLIMARIFQVLGLAIVLTLFFAPLHHNYFSVQNRIGFVQEICAFYFVGMLQNVAIYPAEREVFYREDDDAVYSVEAFLATYTVLEVPCEIISCLIFGVLADLAVGFPRTAELYFVCVFCAFGIVSCGESLGIMFNTLFNHTGFAVNIISVLLSVSQIMAGIISVNMPRLFLIFRYLSPTKYAVAALARFSLQGVEFTCDDSQKLPDGQCTIATGEQVLELYNLNVDGVRNIIALAGTIIVYRLLAWLLVRLVRTRWRSLVESKL